MPPSTALGLGKPLFTPVPERDEPFDAVVVLLFEEFVPLLEDAAAAPEFATFVLAFAVFVLDFAVFALAVLALLVPVARPLFEVAFGLIMLGAEYSPDD